MPVPFAGLMVEAIGSITGAGAVTLQRGGVLARTAVGVYTLTLDRAVPSTECVVLVTPRGGAGNANAQVVHTSDLVKTISLFVAAVATDVGFDVAVLRSTDLTS